MIFSKLNESSSQYSSCRSELGFIKQRPDTKKPKPMSKNSIFRKQKTYQSRFIRMRNVGEKISKGGRVVLKELTKEKLRGERRRRTHQ